MKADGDGASARSKGGEMQSCSALKMAYNDCFNRWYTDKFLKGQWDKEECLVEWEAYRACLSKRLEDRNLSHLLRIETSMHASNRNE
ncbi:TRIAP1/MDM35 family protein [Marchantia polymorpha subsp. ruderalis]|uniref:Uncharacterized protein n=1 Tax=Marchantia polymorpha TaxID=3197 RepID=A0A2R6WCY4_MARPO|nr:hypothetical protein MARPO_0108s0048 [Marchantia polymorpha]BBN19851.1 hypothetical protein Mp_8g14210 [Marchantia polymorpha subsp. ruderalis]|eukprot:PTQ31703.1 hypothetical protein MARPO_0108s0048 [Marchantia polymorpha]